MARVKSEPTFLGIARELRDMIYIHYVAADDGYHYNFESGKLKVNGPHAFALQYTCKQMAREMDGLPLRYNTCTFSTENHSKDLESRAAIYTGEKARWNPICHEIEELICQMVWLARDSINDTVRDKVGRRFPHCLPDLEKFIATMPGDYLDDPADVDWDEEGVPSFVWFIIGPYVRYTLQCLVENVVPQVLRMYPVHKLLRLPFEPWIIPTQTQLDETKEVLREIWDIRHKHLVDDKKYAEERKEYWQYFTRCNPHDGERYRFSAAAAAITFLRSLSLTTRSHIREIVLNETHKLDMRPENHAQGLIPLCEENPKLRVERRINLWRCIIAPSFHTMKWHLDEESGTYESRMDGCHTIHRNVESFLRGTIILPPAITVVIDGQPSLEQSSRLFQELFIPEAQIAVATKECYDRGYFSYSYRSARTLLPDPEWKIKELWGPIRAMVEKRSNISCNFDLGEPWDIEGLIDGREKWSLRDWWDSRELIRESQPEDWTNVAPLPSWQELAAENGEELTLEQMQEYAR